MQSHIISFTLHDHKSQGAWICSARENIAVSNMAPVEATVVALHFFYSYGIQSFMHLK